jgi:predicted nucleotidyltransferase
MNQEFIKKIETLLNRHSKIQLGIIYGSFASGREGVLSDIDLAIGGYEAFTLEQREEISSEVELEFNREVDLVDLYEASGPILTEIIASGVQVLVKDSDLLARILSRMVTDEEDFQRQRRLAAQGIRDEVFNVKK